MAIATLAQIKRELKAKNTVTTLDDFDLIENAAVITDRIEKMLGFGFEPRYYPADAPYLFTASGQNVNSIENTIWLKAPILSIDSLANDGSALVADSQYTVTGEYGQKNGLYVKLLGGGWYPATQYAANTVAMSGWLGYKRGGLSAGFKTSRDKITAAINDTVDTLTVQDVDGIDSRGVPPRFSNGNLVSLTTGGQRELMEVIATDTTANTLTVNRGARGTTAIAHPINTTIEIWYPEDDILRVVKRVAGLYYARKGAYDTMTISDLATTTYPTDLPGEVYGVLQNYT